MTSSLNPHRSLWAERPEWVVVPKATSNATDEQFVTVDGERRVISTHPVRASRNKNGGYDSLAVMQKNWSDGTTTYHCRWVGCDHEGPNYRSTAMHFARHRHGMGKMQPPADGPPPVDHVTQPRIENRIAGLERDLLDAMSAGAKTARRVGAVHRGEAHRSGSLRQR
jgi:hypothetical protein